ncbi:hypothetical protein [Candidatus Harpocratesius sp.]
MLINFDQKSLIFLSFYFVLSLLNLILNPVSRANISEFNIPQSFSTRKDKYGLLIIGLFFTFSHILVLPATSYSYIDIQRHYAYAVLLGRNLDLYLNNNWGNFLAHLFESAFVYSANSNMEIIQICLVFITYFYPLFFYVLIRRFLNKQDSRLPIFATMIYMVGSLGGIGWIYYVKTKLSDSFGQPLLYNNIVNTVYYQTFKSNSYGFLPSYFRPIMVSMFVFFFLWSLMHNFQLSRKNFIVFFSVFLTAMYFIHVVEATLFTFFVGFWGLFFKAERFRMKDSLIAVLIGTFFALIGFIGLNLVKNKIPFIYFAILCLNLILVACALIFKVKYLTFYSSTASGDLLFIPLRLVNRVNKLFPIVGLLFLITAILTWITLWDSYDISVFILNPYRQIPWFFQGLRLGFIGIFGLYYYKKRNEAKKSTQEFNFVIFFSIFAFFVGRLMTFINIFILPENPFYWETRFEVFIIIPFVILATLFMLEYFDKNNNKFHFSQLKSNISNIKENFKGYSLVLLLFFSNFTIVLLNLETRWAVSAPLRSMLIQDTWEETYEGTQVLSNFLDENPYSAIITISSDTFGLINIVGPANLILLEEAISTSSDPTAFLLEVYKAHYWRDSFTYKNIYLYLTHEDLNFLYKYQSSFIGSIIDTLPLIFANSQVSIYNISQISFPVPDSDSALVYPIDDIFENKTQSNIITSLLSQGNANISLALEREKLDNYSNLLLNYDIPNQTALKSLNFNKFERKGYWKIKNENSLKLNGSFFIQRESNITSYQELTSFNLSFFIKWNFFTNSTDSQLKFLFDQDFKLDFSEIIFNYSSDGMIFCYFWDEFAQNINHFPNHGILKSNLPESFTFTAQFLEGNYNFFINNVNILNISGRHPTTNIGFQFINNLGENHITINMTQNNCTEFFSNQKSKEEFYKYVENGQNLIVFNSNGYQKIAADLFELNSSKIGESIEINRIQINNSSFPINSINAENIQVKSNNNSILAYYLNEKVSVPFIIKKKIGDGNLFYVNIFPLISAQNYSKILFSNRSFENLLLNIFNISKFNDSLAFRFIENNIPIKQIFLSDSNITAEDLIIESKDARNIQNIEVKYQNNSVQIFPEIYSFNIKESGMLTLQQSDSLIYHDVNYFFPKILQNQTFKLFLYNDSNIIEIQSGNSTYQLRNVKQINFYLIDDISILIKGANIHTSHAKLIYLIEENTFKNYYMSYNNNHLDYNSFQPYGLSFDVNDLGSVIAISNGNFEIYFPINHDFYYNELKSIPIAIFWLCVEFAIYFLYIKWKNFKKQKKISK